MESCRDGCRGCFPVPISLSDTIFFSHGAHTYELLLFLRFLWLVCAGLFTLAIVSVRRFDADGLLQTTDCILLVGPVRSLFDSDFVAVCLCAACD
jgi:hypothetical protein